MLGRMGQSQPFVCALLLASFLYIADSTNPGVQMRVTEKGMKFAINTGKGIMEEELSKRSFDEQGKKSGVQYHLRRMKITEAAFPEVELEPVAGVGMKGLMKGVVLGGSGNIWYRYKLGWFRFTDDVDFSLKISGIDISLVVRVNTVKDGHPEVELGSCSANVDSVDITFQGSGFKKWIYNLFNGIIAYKMKNTLSKTLCKIIRKEVNERTKKAMSTFPLTKSIDQWAAIDYRLTQTPTFTDTYVDAFFKGEFISVANATESSLTASALEMSSEAEKMVYFLVSEYTLNTAGELYQQSGVLDITMAEWDQKLPLEVRNKLTTNTFEMAIPNLSKYRDLPMSVQFVSYKAPHVAISDNKIRLDIFADAKFNIRQKNGKDMEAFTLRIDMDTDLQGSVVQDRITTKVTEFNYNAKVKHSNIGNIDISLLSMMKFIIEKSVIDAANPKLQRGFPLPKVDMCEFKNMDLQLQEKAVYIGTDAILTL